jgi:hypothetical protein
MRRPLVPPLRSNCRPDPDRDLRDVGVRHHFVGGKDAHAPAAQQLDGAHRAVYDDRDHAERPGVQPGPVAEPGDVARVVGVVEHQQRLRAGDRDRAPGSP